MSVTIEKAPGGFLIDGLELKNGKCGCTSILPCCFSWSKVKRSGNAFSYTAKAQTPETKDNFSWGYTAKKDEITIDVTFDDARDKTIFSGFYPPRVEDLVARGWTITAQNGSRADGTLWRCAACKWLYKEDQQEKKFEDLPADWLCPICMAAKDSFEKVG
ncbi:MAG TPA: rubredoxin [Dissulfurispiraceae bacterium]|nr:rubredoxin [Dissulfurispiraceae bacterium]